MMRYLTYFTQQRRVSRRLLLTLCLMLLSLALYPAPVLATSLPANFTEELVAGGLNKPTAMAFAPDGRIFVTEQNGKLRVIENGDLLDTEFLSLSVDSTQERGLLGVAFDPNFVTNHFVYVYYTTSTNPKHNRVSRFTANGNVALAGETPLIDLDDLSGATNHNGGALHFGPDGKLYVAVGDNANGNNAQSLNNRLGKILRYNADGSIPTGNPFYDDTTGENRSIWALGLRNPYTFAFQPGTGRMFINDVGQDTWEEINDGIVGSNYGWPATEGETSNPDFRSPLFAYEHNLGEPIHGCAITGGAFYNPTAVLFPDNYIGSYFFADYCSDWIRRYDPATDMVHSFASSTANAPVDIHVAPDGNLYYLAGAGGSGGAVYRITYTACLTIPDPAPAGAAPMRNYFTDATPTLTWGRVSWALGYEIQVDNQSDFSHPEFEDNALTIDELEVETTTLNDCSYYWRVRAKRTATTWGAWSPPQSFVIDAVP